MINVAGSLVNSRVQRGEMECRVQKSWIGIYCQEIIDKRKKRASASMEHRDLWGGGGADETEFSRLGRG